jgi:hypothetical protein
LIRLRRVHRLPERPWKNLRANRGLLLLVAVTAISGARQAAGKSPMPFEKPRLITVAPTEDREALLHNPDMGWVLYENFPLDPNPHGSSTLLTLPNERYPGVDAVALMFSWEDVEKQPGVYDFSGVDEAYDYWKRCGKQILLRMSTTTLMWWATAQPPAGRGAPKYVLAHLRPDEKQIRSMDGTPYTVVDLRDSYYQHRLKRFLRAVAAHFSGPRAVDLVDLRGFGAWGEWHSGFRYPSVHDRRTALKAVLDCYSQAFPHQYLALSYSYDPDSPEDLRDGPTDHFDPHFTTTYQEYLHYSAFDYALTKPNITLRRDGAGGAVHSNERRLCAEAFQSLNRGPMTCEFVDGYAASKKGGSAWVSWKIDDALSLHPNYINLLGWQGADALAFMRERPDLFARGLLNMGYRLVPERVQYPAVIRGSFELIMEWANRGVGRAMRDYKMKLLLADAAGKTTAVVDIGTLPTSRWKKGTTYTVEKSVRFPSAAPGVYELQMRLTDPKTGRIIQLPLKSSQNDGAYDLGPITVTTRRSKHPAPTLPQSTTAFHSP